MKQIKVCIVTMLAGGVLLTGCGQKQETTAPKSPAGSETVIQPAAVKATVTDLVAKAQTGVDKALALANSSKFQEALALLQKVSEEVKANPDAQKLVDNAIAKIKQMMADAATKAAADKVGNALGGLGK